MAKLMCPYWTLGGFKFGRSASYTVNGFDRPRVLSVFCVYAYTHASLSICVCVIIHANWERDMYAYYTEYNILLRGIRHHLSLGKSLVLLYVCVKAIDFAKESWWRIPLREAGGRASGARAGSFGAHEQAPLSHQHLCRATRALRFSVPLMGVAGRRLGEPAFALRNGPCQESCQGKRSESSGHFLVPSAAQVCSLQAAFGQKLSARFAFCNATGLKTGKRLPKALQACLFEVARARVAGEREALWGCSSRTGETHWVCEWGWCVTMRAPVCVERSRKLKGGTRAINGQARGNPETCGCVCLRARVSDVRKESLPAQFFFQIHQRPGQGNYRSIVTCCMLLFHVAVVTASRNCGISCLIASTGTSFSGECLQS